MLTELWSLFYMISYFNAVDKAFTGFTISEWRFLFPKWDRKKMLQHELNPLGRWVMLKWGVIRGLLVGLVVSQAVIFVSMDMVTEATKEVYTSLGVVLGLFVMLTVFHLNNIYQAGIMERKETLRLRAYKERTKQAVKDNRRSRK